MKQIKFIISTVLLLIVGSAFADTVAQDVASIVAKNWYNEKQSIFDAEISNTIIEEENSMALYYVFNFVDGGYIIVSAEDNAPAVLGYGSENAYQEDNHPPQFDWLLGNYKQQITAIIDENLQGTEQTANEWSRLSVSVREFQSIGSDRNVDPLIDSHWGQGNSWNDYCPVDASGPGGNAVVGCVAVAQAQIMRYWEHPSQGLGSNSYYHPDYGTISANFGATTYNWSNMPSSSPTNSSRELLFHCGVSVNMDYGPTNSGASSDDVDDAMEDYFYYNSNADMKSRSSYSDAVWEEMLRDKLDSGQPLYYRSIGLHAFNLDGYQGTNYFHFNWGWNGSYDDYFYLSDLTPGGHNYNDGQTAIFDLIPAARVSGHVSLAGGSGYVSYVDVDFERISTGEVYSFDPGTNGDFGGKNLPTGSYSVTYSLNGYRDYIIQSYYINAASLNVEMPDVKLIPIMTGVILVKLDGSGDFTNISYAVQAAEQSAYIFIFGPGTYTGENNKNISWNGNEKHLYIRGANNPVIDCENDGRVFTINNGTEEDIIQDLTIINTNTNYNHGGAIVLNNGSPKLINNTFENCKSGIYPQYATQANGGAIYIEDCGGALIQGNMFDSNSAFSGGALYSENSSLSLTYNTFLSNTSGHILDGTDGSTGIAGAVHIESCFDTNISNNLFEANFSNHASAAMAIVNASENTILEYNTFKENQFGVLNTLGEYGNGILGLYYGKVECRNNLFIDNYAQDYLSHIIDDFYSSNSITNNSFIGNQDVVQIISFGYDVVDEEITNCLFLDNESYSISWGDVTLNNCVVYQSGDLGNGVIEGDGCFININPLLDSNHRPIWNTTQKSPCIDTGNHTSPFDPDETPADIGAVRAVTHDYQLTTAQHDRYRYRSFPVIDRDYIQQGFETTYICAPVEDQTVYFKIFEQYGNYQEWEYPNWNSNHPLVTLDSVEGYKIKTTNDVEIPTSGRTLPENTQVDLIAGENWIGYFVKEPMTIYDAFQDIWEHLEGVYSEDWAWDNSGTIPPERCVLGYGKMYIVYVDQACSFVYGDGTPVPPKEREMTDGFYYEETPTYSPINILSLDDPTVLEVGVLLDGECIGATKVEEFPLQILAFPPEGNRSLGDITFEFYCGGRSYTPASSYQVLNKVTGQYDNSKLELHPYESTSISFGTPIIPIEFTLSGNYPNPFNPSTTISYSLPQESIVSLNIYNVKGQLVKQLISESQPEGYYDVVWNGKNDAGKQASSGIYYYRITACGKTLNKKMLLLK